MRIPLAINLYIAKKHGGPLAPKDAKEDAEMTMWALAATEVETNALKVMTARAGKPEQRDETQAKAAVEALRAPFAVLNEALAASGYLVGGCFTVVTTSTPPKSAAAQEAVPLRARARAGTVRRRAECEEMAGGLSGAPGLQGDVGDARRRARGWTGRADRQLRGGASPGSSRAARSGYARQNDIVHAAIHRAVTDLRVAVPAKANRQGAIAEDGLNAASIPAARRCALRAAASILRMMGNQTAARARAAALIVTRGSTLLLFEPSSLRRDIEGAKMAASP